MPRYALKSNMMAAPFAGWQTAGDQRSVQGAIEAALAPDGTGGPQPSQRPDAPMRGACDGSGGAIAIWSSDWSDTFRLSEALNSSPQAPCRCGDCRRGAGSRRRMARALFRDRSGAISVPSSVSRRAPMTLEAGQVWQVKRHRWTLQAMQEAARHLVGMHDFTTFRSTHVPGGIAGENAGRAGDRARLETIWGTEYQFRPARAAFCTTRCAASWARLERVGAGAWMPEDVQHALEARDRASCGPVCPPQGLYLIGVGYPDDPFRQLTGCALCVCTLAGAQIFEKICLGLCPRPRDIWKPEEDQGLL